MARPRKIKPGFFKNEDLADLDPLARLLFAGLWTMADSEGSLQDRPRKIKSEILPYDDCDCAKFIQDLEDKGFISRKDQYIQIVNFKKHQNNITKNIDATSESDHALAIWGQVCGDVLSVPRKLSKGRIASLKARIKDLGMDGWAEYCQRIRKSPFLCGDNDRGWRADFDFAINPNKMARVLEGKYDKKGNKNGKYTTSDALREVLDEIDRKAEADSASGGTNLCHIGHIREEAGPVENIDASDGGGSSDLFAFGNNRIV